MLCNNITHFGISYLIKPGKFLVHPKQNGVSVISKVGHTPRAASELSVSLLLYGGFKRHVQYMLPRQLVQFP